MTLTSLRVMTYNSHASIGNDDCITPPQPAGVPPNPACGLDIERLASVVRAEQPDIVGLQEVDRFWARTAYTDQPAEFARLLEMDFAFGANLDRQPNQHSDRDHQYGVATLTPHHIVRHRNTLYPNYDGWEQRGLLETIVELYGVREIAILNTHLQVSLDGRGEEAAQQRHDQVAMIVERVSDLDMPVIVIGDFNTPPEDNELDDLIGSEGPLTDAWSARGEGTGNTIFLEKFPAYARIDYILVSQHFNVDAIRVIDNDLTRMASDHLPVFANLTLST